MSAMIRKIEAVLGLLALVSPGALPISAQDSEQVTNTPQAGFTLKANAELVLTNVVARDAKTGELVTGLKQSDFKIFENGKEQQIDSFDFESVDMATPLKEATVSGLAAGPTGSKAVVVAKPEELRNHRLIVMFFDLTSMQPEDLERCVDAAQAFLKTKMQPADLVALVSLGDTLNVDQDFTADKNALINEVGAYNGTEGQGFAQGANSNTNQVEDTTAYTPDESEYNDLNTDRELFALRAISQSLSKINEKKSLLYFSGGISRDGIENEASLRSAINAAVRADLAIYSVDTRGLQAVTPFGDASTGSLRGQGGFNGGALANNMNANFATSGSDGARFPATPAEKHFSTPTTLRRPSRRCRRIIRPTTRSAFTPRTRARWQVPQADGEDRPARHQARIPARILRARGLQALRQGGSRTGTPGSTGQRPARHRHGRSTWTPCTSASTKTDSTCRFHCVVPGSQIPFVKGGDKDKATLDIIGAVIDEAQRPVGRVRDTVKLNLDPALQARQKNIQYTTSFNLPPGKYQLKFVVRENQTGRMGSFIADVTLPDLKKAPLKMSSIVLASQRTPSKKEDPLVRNGEEYVPDISHVFRQDQHMYLLYEIYDPAHEKAAEGRQRNPNPRSICSVAWNSFRDQPKSTKRPSCKP